MELVLTIFMLVVLIAYFYFFYAIMIQDALKKKRLRSFYRSIKSILEKENISDDEILEELGIDYNKIFQNVSEKNTPSLLEMLEQMIFFYDSYTDKAFKSIFGEDKDSILKEKCVVLRKFIKEKEPFSSLPPKEATLFTNIKIAVQEGNSSLCDAVLEQLSTEIINKDILIKKQEKNNKNTAIISVVGIILTIFFGILSFF